MVQAIYDEAGLEQTLAVTIITRPTTSTERTLNVSTAVVAGQVISGQTWMPGLASVGGITFEADAGISHRRQSFEFVLVNEALYQQTTSAMLTPQQLMRESFWLGSFVQLRMLLRGVGSATWTSVVLAEGSIRRARVGEMVTTVRVNVVERELLEIPTKYIATNSMDYGPGADEGEMPEKFLGAAVPIFFGKFHLGGVDNSGNRDNILGYNDIWAQKIGRKHPVVPLAFLSDLFSVKDGDTPPSEALFALFALGDLDAPEIYLQGDWAWFWIYWFPVTETTFGTGHDYLINTLRLLTWNAEEDVALTFCKDQSDHMFVAPLDVEQPYHSAGDWNEEVGDHTAAALAAVKAVYIQRKDPPWDASDPPDYWPGPLQSISLLPDSLSQGSSTTGGKSFGTTGCTNPENALKADDSFCEIGTTGRLSVQLPGRGPALGDIQAIRVVIVLHTWTVTHSADVRINIRRHPGALATTTPDYPSDTALSVVAAGEAKWIPNGTSQIATVLIEPVNSDLTKSWDFVGINAGVPYNFDVVIRPNDSKILQVKHVFMDVVYRTRTNQFTSRTPGAASRWELQRNPSYSVPERPSAWSTDPSARMLHRVWVPYVGNIADPQLKPLGPLSLFASGTGPTDDAVAANARWEIGTGSNNAVVESPAAVALFLIDKYLGQYSSCVTAADVFGSFRNARSQLGAQVNAPFGSIWRLAVVIDQRMSLRRVLDMIQDHSMSAIYRIAEPSGGYTWRMIVDVADPATNAPERLFRRNLTKQDFAPGLEVEVSDQELVRTSFVAKYNWHAPSGEFANELFLNRDSTNMGGTQTSAYQDLCADAEDRYGWRHTGHAEHIPLRRQEVLEFPWIANTLTAAALLRWHAARKARQTVFVYGLLHSVGLELVEGHIVRLDNDVADVLGVYPGVDGGADWDDHQFTVVRRTLRWDGAHMMVDVVLRETHTLPS